MVWIEASKAGGEYSRHFFIHPLRRTDQKTKPDDEPGLYGNQNSTLLNPKYMTISIQTQTRPSAFLPCPVPCTLKTRVGTKTLKAYTLHSNGQSVSITEGRFNRLRAQHNKRNYYKATLRSGGYVTINL